MRSGGDKLRSSLQGVDKRGTRSREIKSPDIFRAQLVLYKTCGRGKKHVRSNRPYHNRIEVGSFNTALRERSLRRLHRQVTGCDPFVHEMTLADANPFHDPLIIGIDHLFEVGVGKKTRRNISAESADLNALKLLQ